MSTATGLERAPQILALAGAETVVVVEHEFRNGDNAGDIDILAQRTNADGEMAWNGGEQSVMVSGSKWLERRPVVLPDGEGGAIVVLTSIGAEGEFEGDEDVWAARVLGDGTLPWEEGKRSVEVAGSDLLERNPSAVVVR